MYNLDDEYYQKVIIYLDTIKKNKHY